MKYSKCDIDAISEKAAMYHLEGFGGILESIPVKHCDFVNLPNVNLKLGPGLGPESIDLQLKEWARQATLSIFKGAYTEGYNSANVPMGKLIADGIQTNATIITKLNGVDSNLSAGDVYKALDKFVGSISGDEINLLMDPLFFGMASGVLEQFKVKNVYVSQDLALVGGIDTPGTHSRLMAWVNSSSVLERAYSRGFGLAAYTSDLQIWSVKLGGCVHDPRGVIFSEQISWRNEKNNEML